jgi:predicted nucleotidyltransferase
VDPVDCRFPALPERYDRALREATAFILSRFEPLGIIAAGTIVRGNPGPSSDHDIFVLVSGSKKQRIQKMFAGVPAEIFVNPPRAVERYFENDRKQNRPITAHMIATGFVVLDRDPEVERLRALAREYLERSAELSEADRIWQRYAAALHLEDALELVETDPEAATFLMHQAVNDMLRFTFFANRDQHVPRWKEILQVVCELDPAAGELARRYLSASSLEERRPLAVELADRICGAHGFFEWESDILDIDDD